MQVVTAMNPTIPFPIIGNSAGFERPMPGSANESTKVMEQAGLQSLHQSSRLVFEEPSRLEPLTQLFCNPLFMILGFLIVYGLTFLNGLGLLSESRGLIFFASMACLGVILSLIVRINQMENELLDFAYNVNADHGVELVRLRMQVEEMTQLLNSFGLSQQSLTSLRGLNNITRN